MAFNSQLLDGMVIFSEVVVSGSFTQAANNSGHSTSYISKEVNKLEERLGVRLLHRTTRTLSLTPEGEVYFQQCQQIIDDAKQAENAVSGKQGEPKGTLKISCPVSFALSNLKPILAKFTAKYPKINLELDLNDRKVDMVSEGFDVLIRASVQMEDSNLISRRIMRSYGVTIASPGYLKEHGVPSHPSELMHHKTITYSHLKQPHVWEFTDPDNQQHHVSLTCNVTTNSPEMELALCLAGQGITRLPYFNLTNEIETGELVELFPDFKKKEIDIYMIYPSRKHMSAKVRSFIDFVMDELGD